MNIKLGKNDILLYAAIANISYEAVATACYSILGNGKWIRLCLIIALLLINLLSMCVNNSKLHILIALAVVFGGLFTITAVFYPVNREFIFGSVADIVRYTLLAYSVAALPTEFAERALKISAYIIFLTGILEPFTHYVTGGRLGYMVYGMRMLTAAVLLFCFYFREKQLVHFIAGAGCSVLVLLYGNRSALLIIAVCFIFQWLVFTSTEKRILRGIASVFACLSLVLVLASNFLDVVSVFLEKLGISSRTMNKLLEGADAAFDNSGRSVIWKNCRDAISRNPILGYGVGGDRYLGLLGERYTEVNGNGIYAHNFIYEILIEFGVVLGIMLLSVMAVFVILVIRNKYKWPMKKIYVIFLLSTVIKLSVSSSLWVDMSFYLCLGIVINYFVFGRRKVRHRMMEIA